MHKAPRILRALVAMALAIPALALVTPVAHAEEQALVDVSITAISTPVLDLTNPDEVVEISGTIINTSASRTRFTTVEFWKSTTPITSTDELEAALTSAPADPVGKRQEPWDEESGHTQIITRDEWFATGQRAAFRVSATVGELELPMDDAAYLLGIQVRGIPDDGGKQVVGRGRILVVAATSPLASHRVVQLAAGPQRSQEGDFKDDSLATSLTTDLDDLLTAAEDSGATILLDPMLLMDARALAEEHTTAGVPRPPDADAEAWATRVDTLISSDRALRLPWADVDLPRAHATGHMRDAVQWADDALSDEALRRLPLAANLESFATPEMMDEIDELGFTTVFTNNTTGGRTGGVRVVRVGEVDQPGMGPGGKNTSAQQVGRRVAEEAVADIPPTYLARTTAQARAAMALPAHRTGVALPPDQFPASFTDAEVAPPWEKLSGHIDELMADASFRRDLTGDDGLSRLERLAAGAWSSAFTTEEAALEWFGTSAVPELDPSKITITAASQFVMGSRTNDFPVTITNGLEMPVTLRLVFDSESPQRISVPATDFNTLQPGENLTLILKPQASSNGAVTVHGHMETRGGERFGSPVEIDITATELGRVGWIIIIVSGAVVLGGTVWRIRAVQAERSEEDA